MFMKRKKIGLIHLLTQVSVSHTVFWSPLSHTAMGRGLGARPYQAMQISQRLCWVCHLEWGILPCCRLREYSCFSLKHVHHMESRQLPCFICGGQSSFHWGTKRVCIRRIPWRHILAMGTSAPLWEAHLALFSAWSIVPSGAWLHHVFLCTPNTEMP